MDWSDAAIACLQDLDLSISEVKVWCQREKSAWDEVAKENLVVKTW